MDYWNYLIEGCRKQRHHRILEQVYNWIGVFALGWFMAILLTLIIVE